MFIPNTLPPLSSFTLDWKVAGNSACDNQLQEDGDTSEDMLVDENMLGDGDLPEIICMHKYVIFALVPVKRVFSLFLTGFGCLSEYEVTVLGSNEPFVVSKVHLHTNRCWFSRLFPDQANKYSFIYPKSSLLS